MRVGEDVDGMSTDKGCSLLYSRSLCGKPSWTTPCLHRSKRLKHGSRMWRGLWRKGYLPPRIILKLWLWSKGKCLYSRWESRRCGKTGPLLGSDLEEDHILERREGNTVAVGCGVASPRGTRGTFQSAGQDGACYNLSLGRWRQESRNSGSSFTI